MLKYITNNNIKDISTRNVYIYGAGVYADDVNAGFSQAGIQAVAFIVDDKYLPEHPIMGKNIISLSHYKNIKCKGDVVVNGIASVSGFRRVLSSGEFDDFRVFYDPAPLWKNEKGYIEQHYKEIKKIEKLYADEKSVQVMRAFLRAKSGEEEGIAEDISLASEEGTYFNSLTKEKAEGAFIDCGAFDGDSTQEFFSFLNEQNQCEVFAFESDADNYRVLKDKFLKMNNVHCINKGVWNKEDTLVFTSGRNMGSGFAEAGGVLVKTKVTDIDSVVGETKVSFIKMDIEGCELKGLQGAEVTIKRDHPILAISAYHKKEDTTALPKYIKTLETDEWRYKLYLRHHGVCASELVLYAIPFRNEQSL